MTNKEKRILIRGQLEGWTKDYDSSYSEVRGKDGFRLTHKPTGIYSEMAYSNFDIIGTRIKVRDSLKRKLYKKFKD